VNGQYVEQSIAAQTPLFWMPEIQLGLGLWQGRFRGVPQPWLRWCDANGNWLLTETEIERQAKEQERQAREGAELREQEAKQAKERLEAYLRSQGIDPDNLPS
jgi:RecB family exonuclease